jgi:hypothetical protein
MMSEGDMAPLLKSGSVSSFLVAPPEPKNPVYVIILQGDYYGI